MKKQHEGDGDGGWVTILLDFVCVLQYIDA